MTVTEELAWQDAAACTASGQEFVDVSETAARQLAGDYCRRCPVVVQCRAYAAGLHPAAVGVWGGWFYPGAGHAAVYVAEEAS